MYMQVHNVQAICQNEQVLAILTMHFIVYRLGDDYNDNSNNQEATYIIQM